MASPSIKWNPTTKKYEYSYSTPVVVETEPVKVRKTKRDRVVLTYVLKLTDNCWYVGKTDDLNKRYDQHMNGEGASWTKAHKPISIYRVYIGDIEEQIYNKVVEKYGKGFVRGYTKCAEHDPDHQHYHAKRVTDLTATEVAGLFNNV